MDQQVSLNLEPVGNADSWAPLPRLTQSEAAFQQDPQEGTLEGKKH